MTLTMMAPQKAPKFGELLRTMRDEYGLSQAVLAQRAGVHPNTVAMLERGERGARVGWQIVDSLARGLDLTMAERDELMAAAGYDPKSPQFVQAVIEGHPTLDKDAKALLLNTLRLFEKHSRDGSSTEN